MNRRHFVRIASSAAGLAGLPHALRAMDRPPGLGRALDRLATGSPQVAIDPARLGARMTELARFGANTDGGIDRVAFSDANVEALDWMAGLLEEAGFTPSIDLVGNLIATRPGTEAGLAPIMFGSHIDSVPGGGNYDGQVGSMGSLEVATALGAAGVQTRHPLEVAVFCNEEGGKTGSRALAGEVEEFELEIETASGLTIAEGLRRLGGDPDRLAEARRAPGTIASFVELHVEQGFVLDQDGIDIGVVEGIVGIMRWNVTVDGMTNHAGTTPMNRRRDAMVVAARIVDAVHRTALGMPGRQVATVGRLAAEPGAPNVIPGRVTFTLEIRDLTMDGIDRTFDAIRQRATRIAQEAETEVSFERFYTSRAAPTAEPIRARIETAAQELGLSARRMPSGAGHDAQSIALLAPVGMIFVPSRDGISHSPREFTEAADVVNGTRVLLGTLLAMDRL